MRTYNRFNLDSSPELVDTLLKDVRVCGRIAVDTETFGDRPLILKEKYAGLRWSLGDHPFMCQFAASSSTAYITYKPETAKRVLEGAWNLEEPYFLFHNAKFDLHMLRCWPGCDWIPGGDYDNLVEPRIRIQDTMLSYSILYPGKRKALKIASKDFVTDLDVDGPQKRVEQAMTRIRSERRTRVGRGKWMMGKPVTFKDVPPEIMEPYATQDVILTLLMDDALEAAWVTKSDKLRENYEIELKLLPLLIQMEKAGEDIDEVELKRQLLEAEEQRSVWRDKLATFTDADPNKPVELRRYLYTDPAGLREEVKFKTDSGEPSTDELSLRSLKNKEVSDVLLHWRWWNKAHSKLNELSAFCINGKVYCDMKQDGAKTGRFSAVAPALQNIPRYDPAKPWAQCRRIFRAAGGYISLYIDYSAIEMRIFADFSKDAGLIKTFNEGGDPHKYVTSLMYGIAQEVVTKLQRDFGKTMSFTILYGGGQNRVYEALAFGAAASDPLPIEEAAHALCELRPEAARDEEMMALPHRFLAKALIDAYYTAIPASKEFKNEVIGVVKTRSRPVDPKYPAYKGRGYVVTKFGREVTVPPEASHIAVNALIQGTASDMLKRALLIAYKECKEFCRFNELKMWEDVQMNLSIHDEIKFRLRDNIPPKNFVTQLEGPLTVWPEFKDVKFKVEAKFGGNWAETEKVA